MKVKQALEKLRMRCSRSEHCRSQAEKLLRKWIAASSVNSREAVDFRSGYGYKDKSAAGNENESGAGGKEGKGKRGISGNGTVHKLRSGSAAGSGSGRGPRNESKSAAGNMRREENDAISGNRVCNENEAISGNIADNGNKIIVGPVVKENETVSGNGVKNEDDVISAIVKNGQREQSGNFRKPEPGIGPERENGTQAAENPALSGNREEKQLTAADIPYILHLLEEERFIDDRRFAGAYVRDKLRFNGWGKNKISYMLRSLGVEDNIIREALMENYRDASAWEVPDYPEENEFPDGAGITKNAGFSWNPDTGQEPDAGRVLRKLVENKWKSLKKNEPLQTRKMKVLRFAVGRGFEYSRVLEILQEIAKNDREERDEDGSE